MTHKEKCKELKAMRKEMADKIGLDLHQTECTYKGECSGTCPRCMQEEKKLNKALLAGGIALASVVMGACSVSDGGMEHGGDRRVSNGAGRESGDRQHSNRYNGGGSGGDIAGDVAIDPEPTPDVEVLAGDVEYYPGDDMLEGEAVCVRYDEEEILELCKKYSGAPIVEVDYYEGDIAHIHCYEYVDDGDGTGHTATYDWIDVDMVTGTATNLLGEEIDLFE